MQLFRRILYKLRSWVRAEMSTQLDFFPNHLNVKVKRLSPTAKMPTKAYADDAGWDVYAIQRVYIEPYQTVVVQTGLAFEMTPGWHMQVHTRSSYGKRGIRCHLGIVDSGYRNELGIIVQNNSLEHFIIEKGDKFAQLLFLPVPNVTMTESDTLNETDRGQGGFGSSGR